MTAKLLPIAIRPLVVMLFCLAAIGGSTQAAEPKGKAPAATDIRVMIQNLFIGAEFSSLVDVTSPEQIPGTVAAVFQQVNATNFPERAATLAKHIAEERPHLIGLNEVARFLITSQGEVLDLNFLEILQNALEAHGLQYEEAVAVNNVDIDVPIFLGIDEIGNPIIGNLGLTNRDVILARSDVETSSATAENYPFFTDSECTRIIMPVPGLGVPSIPILRGFVAVDATVNSLTVRFVNTHLEQSVEPGIQACQAGVLINKLANEDLPIILGGDINSSPDAHINDLGIVPPYQQFIDAGYQDVWPRRPGRDDGFTCCQDEDLLNEDSKLDERSDIIFVRNDLGFLPISILGRVRARIFGDDPADKTQSEPQLWHSDHAAVIADIKIPVPQAQAKR